MEVGLREIEAGEFALARRDKIPQEKIQVKFEALSHLVPQLLNEIQDNLYHKAKQFRDAHTLKIDRLSDFYDFFADKEEIHGGFALCHWNEDPAIEAKVKEDLNVTIRCIPLDVPSEPGSCLFTGQKSPRRVLFAKAY